MDKELSTEEKIIKAAEKVFIAEGYAGARMQQIANEAQINKAMVHYYFKSKEKLMQQVFMKKFKAFMPQVQQAFQAGASFEVILKTYIENYLNMLDQNPYLPLFLIDTMHRNPEFIDVLPDLPGQLLVQGIERQIELGNIRPIKPYHLLLNIVGMCIFPVLARPMFEKVFQLDDQAYQQILKERRDEVYNFVMKAVKPE